MSKELSVIVLSITISTKAKLMNVYFALPIHIKTFLTASCAVAVLETDKLFGIDIIDKIDIINEID